VKRVFQFFSSLRLTVWLLGLGILVVFFGTLAQRSTQIAFNLFLFKGQLLGISSGRAFGKGDWHWKGFGCGGSTQSLWCCCCTC
jgi:hypothetical protein